MKETSSKDASSSEKNPNLSPDGLASSASPERARRPTKLVQSLILRNPVRLVGFLNKEGEYGSRNLGMFIELASASMEKSQRIRAAAGK